MKIKNHFETLGIESDNNIAEMTKQTNESIRDAYINKLEDLYIERYIQLTVQKGRKVFDINRDNKEERNKLKNTLKRALNQKVDEELMNAIPTRNSEVMMEEKIKILKNLIEEQEKGRSEKEQRTVKMLMQRCEMSYEAIKTEKQRQEYIGTILKKIELRQNSEDDIKNQDQLEEKLRSVEYMKGDIVNNVRKKAVNIPEYAVLYENEGITLCHKSTIMFDNTWFSEEVTEYAIFIRDEQNNNISSYSFYGNVNIMEMHDEEYREALFQAISQTLQEAKRFENPKYIGSIVKDQRGYYMKKAETQVNAIVKYERKKMENRRNRIKGDASSR